MSTIQTKNDSLNNQDYKQAFGEEQLQKQDSKSQAKNEIPEFEVYSHNGIENITLLGSFDDFDLALKKMYSENKKTGLFCAILNQKIEVVCSVRGESFVPTVTPVKLTSGDF